MSKHAAGPAPAGWQGSVVKQVPSTQIAPDDPGHTYHLLNDGSAVATTEPKRLADPQAAALRAKDAEEAIEKFIDEEIKILATKKFDQATAADVKGLLIALGGFEIGLVKIHKVDRYPDNPKVIAARTFIAEKRAALEDKCHSDITLTVLIKTGAPKFDPAGYAELEALKAPIERWQAAFAHEKPNMAMGEGECKFALDEIGKAQEKILEHRDAQLRTAKSAIDGVDAKSPGETIKTELAKVSTWLEATNLPDANGLRAQVKHSQKRKEDEISEAGKAAAAAAQAPQAQPQQPQSQAQPQQPQSQAQPEQQAQPPQPQLPPPLPQPQAQQQPQSPQPQQPQAQPQPPQPQQPQAQQEPQGPESQQQAQSQPAQPPGPSPEEQIKLKQIESLVLQLQVSYLETMRGYEKFNTGASVVGGALGVLAPIPALGFGAVKLVGGFFYKTHKRSELIHSLEALMALDAAGLEALEKHFETNKDFDDAVDKIVFEAKRMAEGAVETAKEDKVSLVVDVADVGGNIAAVAGASVADVIGPALSIVGFGLAVKDLRANTAKTREKKDALEKAKKELEELRAGGSAPTVTAPPATS